MAVRKRVLRVPSGSKRPKRIWGESALEAELDLQLRALRITGYEREVRFDPKRRWRFDFCWLEGPKIAVECEGGIWSGGRHTTGAGFAADCEKYNAAAQRGWRVFRYTARDIKSGRAVEQIAVVLADHVKVDKIRWV